LFFSSAYLGYNAHFFMEDGMRKIPARFQDFSRKHPDLMAAYENLAAQCHKAGPLNARDRALVKLGIAAGANSEGLVRSQVRKALDLGFQPEEIIHAIMLSLPSTGFAQMMSVLTWAESVLSDEPN
jgi:alkylhydroperoxidase/carboxymuconolactone decarboxylase family protein YurZ